MVIRDIYLLQRSEQFNLGPRQEMTVDLSLKRVPKELCTVLIGSVAGRCGQIEEATVKVLDRNNMPVAHTVTDQKGRFVFENILPPGEYKVIATAEGYRVSGVYRLMPSLPGTSSTKAPMGMMRTHWPQYSLPTSGSNTMLSMVFFAARQASMSSDAI